MAYARQTVVLASGLMVLGALASCGTEIGTATGTSPRPSAPTERTSAFSTPPAVPSDTVAASVHSSVRSPSARADEPTQPSGTRCRTSELSASVGRMDPGAGQRNFPVVLTNDSSRTCTVYGYPGAAFVDAAGRQLGPDPVRTPGDARSVTLAPGESAWAGLRYASPGVSGARTAVPAALLVTPPDEREPLKVPWKAGEVPVGGNSSKVFLTVLQPGAGP
ncbi:DUF4232 domain-containing protein [Streptomyces sp. 15-116A]|uniref:DUF4232 domain-containing protein n=1 Tax=Streptomyces sp. 15-116A TaxID=2259035 RepID=UPI0021B284BE|nr:DUF4232 domain-containing protein [Streptomyces sp. 15-116A]MCT7353542.1 DUF4232 domain-containing protein [Streptomyces sp. 15-116A]